MSTSQLESVREYLAPQEEHHRNRRFQEEYLEFSKRSGVEYDDGISGEPVSIRRPAGADTVLGIFGG